MRQSGGLPLAAGLDGGDTMIKSNPSSSAKRKKYSRLLCPVRDGGKRSAVAEVNDSPGDCQSCDGTAHRRLSALAD